MSRRLVIMPCRGLERQGAFMTRATGHDGMVFHWLFCGCGLLFDEAPPVELSRFRGRLMA